MRTIVLGCNHVTAGIEFRERTAFDSAARVDALRRLRDAYPQCEAVILSTCNRSEIYLSRPLHGHPRFEELLSFVAAHRGIAPDVLRQYMYYHEDAEAIRHLFRVVSSLDSMVIGESQILGQAKEAFRAAAVEQAARRRLTHLFQKAFSVAKEVQAGTRLMSGRVSVGSLALECAQQTFPRLDDKQVLVVGTGKMGKLTLRHILRTHPQRIILTSRRAGFHDLRTTQPEVEFGDFAHLIDHVTRADIVVSCTSCAQPIFTVENMNPVPPRRSYKPLLMLDLAVPRNVGADVGSLTGIALYNIDHLREYASENIERRRKQVDLCESLIERRLAEYLQREAGRQAGPIIAALDQHLDDVAQQELSWLMSRLQSASPRDRAMIRQMVRRLTRKILHHPSRCLVRKAAAGRGPFYGRALRHLFELPLPDVEDEA